MAPMLSQPRSENAVQLRSRSESCELVSCSLSSSSASLAVQTGAFLSPGALAAPAAAVAPEGLREEWLEEEGGGAAKGEGAAELREE